MKNKIIRLGIAGGGWIAQNAHIPAIQLQHDVVISSIFDIDIMIAKRVAKKFDIENFYDNYDIFLDSGIDGVIICTPNYTHKDYTERALMSGKHVLCEKPITITVQDARDIIKISHNVNKLFIPGFVNRFREDVKKMKEIIEEGKIGDINRVMGKWIRKQGVPRPGTWFTNKKLSGGGVLIDLGSHIIDICLMLCSDQSIKKVYSNLKNHYTERKDIGAVWFEASAIKDLKIDVEDTVTGSIVLDRSVIELELSWLSEKDGDCCYFMIEGTEGIVELKTLFGFSKNRLWDKTTLVLIKNGNVLKSFNLSEDTNNAFKAFIDLGNYFVESIKKGKSAGLSGEDGYRTVEAIEKLYEYEENVN